MLTTFNFRGAFFFLPRSSLSRPVLAEFFQKQNILYEACTLYETQFQAPSPSPNFSEIDEIVFTSPSTVHAFFQIHTSIPAHVKCTAIGPITKKALINCGKIF